MQTLILQIPISTLSEWTEWEECSSTCNMLFSVPQQKRTRNCLGRGSICKEESLEQFQNCNELVFCTEYTQVLSLKNFEVKKGAKIATLLFLSKNFKIDFEFCFTTVGECNNLDERSASLFRFGPLSHDICDFECEIKKDDCESRYLEAYFGPATTNGINIIFANCLAGHYRKTKLSIKPGCVPFQIIQLLEDGSYWILIKIDNIEVSKFQNENPKNYKSVDIFFSDIGMPSQHGVVKYLSVANADCCTLSEWTAWGECSSTCNTVFSVPQQKRIRKCLGSGSNCKGELIEQVRNCNELVFCTDYSEMIMENFVKENKKLSILFLSKSFKIDFEFCFTVGENNNRNKHISHLFRLGQELPNICDFDCEIKWKRCESRYLNAFLEPATTNEINMKFGNCLNGTYSENDISVNQGCIRFQIAQGFDNGFYWSIIKVNNVELFKFQNANPKDLLKVYLFFNDDEYASQPGIVTYLSIANADCCALGGWGEWSPCSETCQSDVETVPKKLKERFCLNTDLNRLCHKDLLWQQYQNCNENVSCLVKS
ncbi:uncharacterized protein LOC136096183 [Hydra vulgaris]|uniref:uncharacterized protein LOC136096183 n=1 Tax=Hydra vulgaris TaxID=6087 RepID=UPI0032EA1DE7